MEGAHERRRVAAHVADEDAGAVRGGFFGSEDGARGGEGERQRLLDEDVLPRAEGRDRVRRVVLVRGEDEDDVNGGVGQECGGGGRVVRDVEFCGAVGGRLGGDVADGGEGEEGGEEREGREVDDLRDLGGKVS